MLLYQQRHPLKTASSAASFPTRPPSPTPVLCPPAPAYLVVILAGPGEDLFPLINNQPSDLDEPDQLHRLASKPSLPVLNRPMVEYTLDWVEQSALGDVLILTSESQRTSLNAVIKTRKSSSTSAQPLQIRLECLPDHDLINHGTAGTLRWAINNGLIKTAFVLLPCDLYFQSNRQSQTETDSRGSQTDMIFDRSLVGLIERHRTNQNLLTSVFYERHANSLDLKDGPPLHLVTLDPRTGVLLNVQELDSFGSEMTVRMKMVERFPTSLLSSSLVPAHVYVCAPTVIELLRGLPRLTSFKHQFVPWLAKNQWQPGLLEKTVTPATKLEAAADPLTAALMRSSTNAEPLASQREAVPPGTRTPLTAASTPTLSRSFSYLSLDDRAQPTPLSHHHLRTALIRVPQRTPSAFRCEYVLWRASDGFVCRANSVPGFAEINRTALKLENERRPQGARAPQTPGGGGTAGPDSLVGLLTTLMEKSSVKKSVVGKSCRVGKMSKVANSVLMDRVTLGEHVKIDNCIICSEVVIGDRVELKDCEVESGTVIESDFVSKGEKIARC